MSNSSDYEKLRQLFLQVSREDTTGSAFIKLEQSWLEQTELVAQNEDRTRLTLLLNLVENATASFPLPPVLEMYWRYYQGRFFEIGKEDKQSEQTYRAALARYDEILKTNLSQPEEQALLKIRLLLLVRLSVLLVIATRQTQEARQLMEKVSPYLTYSLDASHSLPEKSQIQLEWQAYYGLALINYSQGQLEQSIKYSLHSLKLLELIYDPMGKAKVSNNLGVYYLATGHWEEASQYLEASIQLRQKAGNQRSIGSTFGNLGAAYTALGRYEEALDRYEAALTIFQANHQRTQIAVTQRELASLYNMQNQPQRALEYLGPAIEGFKELQNSWELARALTHQANSYLLLKQPTKARQLIASVLELLNQPESHGHSVEEGGAYQDLAEVLIKLAEVSQETRTSTKEEAQQFKEQAIHYLRLAVDKYQDNTSKLRAYWKLATTLEQLTGDQYRQVALHEYSEWWQRLREQPTPQILPQLNQIFKYAGLLQGQEALAVYQKAFELSLQSPPIKKEERRELAGHYRRAAHLLAAKPGQSKEQILQWLDTALQLYEQAGLQKEPDYKQLKSEIANFKKTYK